jgi:hypothetical protein
MPILTTVTAIGKPVAIFTNYQLSGYFKPVINRITNFLLLLQFLIFFNKKPIFGCFPATQLLKSNGLHL